MTKYCILFASPIGAGKSPIANYLSCNLNLPVFNNDNIRTEVLEDLGHPDEEEFKKRRDVRLKKVIDSGISFIYDASIDRTWSTYREELLEKGYRVLIISIDLSKEKLVNLYKVNGYTAFEGLDRTYNDHQKFLKEYSRDVSVSIGDNEFNSRLDIVLEMARRVIQ